LFKFRVVLRDNPQVSSLTVAKVETFFGREDQAGSRGMARNDGEDVTGRLVM
jgi:hypothetical protein